MKTHNFLSVAAVAAALAAPAVIADQDDQIDSRWYINPQLGYHFTDSERQLDDDGYGLQLNFGREVGKYVNFEFNVFGNQLEGDNDAELNQFGAGADLLFIRRRDGIQPFALIGGGAMWSQAPGNNNDDSDANAYGDIGFGAMFPVSENGSKIRLEARHRAERNDDLIDGEKTFQDTIVSVGLQMPFGSKPAEPVIAVVPVTPLDSDNDGVPNSRDRCPNTAPGVRVNANGCELDSDNDGVVDSQDRCPNTAAGVAVNAQGCPRDSDNDGITDDRDQCPNTAAGTRVDFTGCELAPVINLEGVNFELDSAKLLPSASTRLDGAVQTLRRYPDTRVLIAGHTDSQGAASYNMTLSKNRANTVRDYLVRNGVNANQLTVKGFGESEPVATNANRTGRALNRRVELRVLN